MSRPYRYDIEKQYPAAPLKGVVDTERQLARAHAVNVIPPIVRQGYANHRVAQSAAAYDQLVKALCVDYDIPGVPEEQQVHWISVRLKLLLPAQTRDLIQQVCDTRLCKTYFTAQPVSLRPRGAWGVAFVPKGAVDQKPRQVPLPDFFVDYLMPTARARRIGKPVTKLVLQRREARERQRQRVIEQVTQDYKEQKEAFEHNLNQAQLRVEPLRLTGEVKLDDSGSESSESEAEWDRDWELEPPPAAEPAAAVLMPPPAARVARPDPALAEALRRLETWGEDDPRQAANEATARRAMSQLRRLGDTPSESEEVMGP